MASTEYIGSDLVAVRTILHEHDRVCNVIMLTTDLAIGISNGEDMGVPEAKG